MIKRGYLNYIHTFRGLAIVGIVAIHCRVAFDWANQTHEYTVRLLFDNSTILFVFIAGFLFEHLKHKYEYSSYLKRKAKYVIFPYIIVSIPPILDKLFISVEWSGSKLGGALYYISSGKHFGPFWFIPMIAIFYLISPLLLRLNKDRFYQYIFPLIFIGGLFFYRFGYYSTIGDSFLYFLPIYLLGMMASKYKNIIHQQRWLFSVPVLCLYWILLALEAYEVIPAPRLQSFHQAATDPWLLFNGAKLKMSVLCFVLMTFLYEFENRKIGLINLLGDYSFGIYFLHLYFIILSQHLVTNYFDGFTFNLITYALYLMVITALSMLAVHLVKLLIGKRSRLLIGS
ncbi:MAG: acyltransferase [Fulvivirga sp.]|nr:acyltransferase [Fulvivirga sp.]